MNILVGLKLHNHVSEAPAGSWWPLQDKKFRVMIYYKTLDQHKSYRVYFIVVRDDEKELKVCLCNQT